ncbi:GPTC1 protein, partial [Polypterus senegalus]
MTEWERGREREEFVRAAMLYKPSNSTLASRFTQGKHEDDSENVYVVPDHEDDLNDKEAAVKMKMFGQLTRDAFEWHPDKLLCKRFNIPDPYPSSSIVGLTKVKKDKYSVFNFLNVMENTKPHLKQSQSDLSTNQKPDKASIPLKSNRQSRWDVPGKENDKKDSLSEFITFARSQSLSERQGSQPDSSEPAIIPKEQTAPTLDDLEEKRPSMDLFKAIFANSSDDESSSEGDGDDEDNQQGQNKSSLIKDPTSLIECQEPSKNKTKETFSNQEECQPTKSSDTSENLATQEEFGPRLPPVVPYGTVSLSSGSVFPETIKRKYKEKQNKHKPKMDHKQKRYKKKKKHRKHKHKSKSKKKIIEGCTSSSDSTESSGSDTGASSSVLSTEELLKSTTYITCPTDPKKGLGIKLPFLVMIIKNLKKYFTFEVQVVDDKDMRRRFRASNFQSTTRIKTFSCTLPLRLDEGWNYIQFNLPDFTWQTFRTKYIETHRVQV